jgi:glucuronate isomerase
MIEYVIDKANHLYRVQMNGSNSAADLARHYSKVLDDPNYDPTLDTITYIDNEADGPILAELPEAGRLMEAMAQLQQGRKWALVMSPGFKRTIVEFLLTGVKLGSVHMRFFDNDAQALAWLDQARYASIARHAH